MRISLDFTETTVKYWACDQRKPHASDVKMKKLAPALIFSHFGTMDVSGSKPEKKILAKKKNKQKKNKTKFYSRVELRDLGDSGSEKSKLILS